MLAFEYAAHLRSVDLLYTHRALRAQTRSLTKLHPIEVVEFILEFLFVEFAIGFGGMLTKRLARVSGNSDLGALRSFAL